MILPSDVAASAPSSGAGLRIPQGYAVPVANGRLVGLLHRLDFRSIAGPGDQALTVEIYRIARIRQAPASAGGRWKLAVESRVEIRRLDRYRIFPANGGRGHSLAMFLELESTYSLIRLPGLGLTPIAGQDFAVLRLATQA